MTNFINCEELSRFQPKEQIEWMAQQIMQSIQASTMQICGNCVKLGEKVYTCVYLSWGAHDERVIGVSYDGKYANIALEFKVQGHKYNGKVIVEMDEGADLFNVYFRDGNAEVADLYGVYFDEIGGILDRIIETEEEDEEEEED